MLADFLRGPARARGLQPYLEILGWMFVLLLVNMAVLPERPGVPEMRPHPLLLMTALMAGRYGLMPGVVAALLSVAGLGAIVYQFTPVESFFDLFRGTGSIPAVSLLLVGLLVGELREGLGRKYAILLDEYDGLWIRFQRLAKSYTLLQDEKYLLDKAVLSDRTPLEFVSELVENMDTLEEEAFQNTALKLMKEVSRASGVALYMHRGEGRMILAQSLGGGFEENVGNDPLVWHMVDQRRVVTAADLPNSKLEEAGNKQVQVAVPLLHVEEDVVVGLVLLRDVPLSTFSRMRLTALEVAGRMAGRMAARIDLHRRTLDRNVLDSRIDAYTAFYLQKRGREELERSMDRGLPLSAVTLAIPRSDDLDKEKETILLETLAEVLNHCLRSGQIVARAPAPAEKGFIVLMPLDTIEEARKMAERIKAEIESFQLRPYGDDRILELHAVAVALYPGMRSWEQAEAALMSTGFGVREGKSPAESVRDAGDEGTFGGVRDAAADGSGKLEGRP